MKRKDLLITELTQMEIAERVGVVNDPPVATCVVPAAFEYQYNVPFPVAVNVAVCPHPTVAPDAVGNEIGFTVTVTGILGDGQPFITVCTQYVVVVLRIGVVKFGPMPTKDAAV